MDQTKLNVPIRNKRNGDTPKRQPTQKVISAVDPIDDPGCYALGLGATFFTKDAVCWEFRPQPSDNPLLGFPVGPRYKILLPLGLDHKACTVPEEAKCTPAGLQDHLFGRCQTAVNIGLGDHP